MPQKKNLVGVRKRFKKDTISYDKVVGFVKKQIEKWLPKASHYGYTREDLRSESYVAFYKALHKYEGDSRYGPHFFSLFKTFLYNQYYSKFICWYDLDRKDVVGASTEIDETIKDSDNSKLNSFSLPGVPVAETSSFMCRLKKEAPEVVVEALNFMINATPGELASYGFTGKGSHGFKSNKRFCVALGYDPNTVNIMDEVKKFIINAD